MKALLLTVITAASFSAWAQDAEPKTRVLLKDSKVMPAEISTTTVRCTEIGYGAQELKINLAGLDGWTLFDHTNAHVGEFGEPCMTAGRCKAPWDGPGDKGFTIDDLIQNRPGTEIIKVEREVVEVKMIINRNGERVCQRSLREHLDTKVRGIAFHHIRWGAEQDFPVEVCLKTN